MDCRESTWNGFRRLDFTFEEYPAILVLPEKPNAERRLVMKTEYFDAFPETEIALLRAGYHLCYLKNRSRWGTDDDCARKYRFIEFLHTEFGLYRKVVCVGMSCGGLHAVCFASRYPDSVSFLYLDAPLLRFTSVAPRLWEEKMMGVTIPEVMDAYGFGDYSEVMIYADQPITRLPVLADHKLPIGLVYGLNDELVPPYENAEVVASYYAYRGAPIKVWARPCYGHHPHGLADPQEMVDYIRSVEL